jgi:hypothetical protein
MPRGDHAPLTFLLFLNRENGERWWVWAPPYCALTEDARNWYVAWTRMRQHVSKAKWELVVGPFCRLKGRTEYEGDFGDASSNLINSSPPTE